MINKEEFQKLSKREQKIAIAYDVIQQIQIYKLLPTPGTYFQMDFFNQCHVCAIGAPLACLARMNDMSPVETLKTIQKDDGGSIYSNKLLAQYFTPNELSMMEYAFELRMMSTEDPVAKFYCRLTPTGRIIAIMQNIIRNGTFDYYDTRSCPALDKYKIQGIAFRPNRLTSNWR